MRLSILKIGFVLMITFSLSGCIGAEWQTREIIQNPDGLNRIERNSYTTEHEFKQIGQSLQFTFNVVETSHVPNDDCGAAPVIWLGNGYWMEKAKRNLGKDHLFQDRSILYIYWFWSGFLGLPHYYQWKQDLALTVKQGSNRFSKHVATIRFTKRNFKLLSWPVIGSIVFPVWMPCIYYDMDTDEIITDYYNTLPLSQRYTLIKNNPESYNYFYDLEQLDQLLWKYPGAVIREFSKVPDFVLWRRLYEDAKKHGMEATFVYLFWETMKNSQRQTFYRVVPDSPFSSEGGGEAHQRVPTTVPKADMIFQLENL